MTRKAATTIIATMCEHGFMSGWFGDTSEKFQQEKVDELMALTAKERKEWIEKNKFNLTTYCGLNPIPT